MFVRSCAYIIDYVSSLLLVQLSKYLIQKCVSFVSVFEKNDFNWGNFISFTDSEMYRSRVKSNEIKSTKKIKSKYERCIKRKPKKKKNPNPPVNLD